MSQIAEQKCPTCGAPLRFDPASGMLVCDYCGTNRTAKAKDSQEKKETGRERKKLPKQITRPKMMVGGFDFDSLDDLVTDPNAMNLPVYNCVSCGAKSSRRRSR